MAISAKRFRADLKKHGIFYTDAALAKEIKSYCPPDVKEVYDPTCGDGMLLSVFDDDVKKYGQDILAEQVECARQNIPNFTGVVGDTLLDPAFTDKKFKCIVANPPFSIRWSPDQLKDDDRFTAAPVLPPPGKADYAFILHILHYLADDGVAVCLSFPGVLYRGQREGKIREWLVRQNYVDKVIHISGGHFEDTQIATCILVLRKNKTDTRIHMIDTEINMDRVVEFDEVEQYDFNLSVNMYVQKPEEKEEVDPVALQRGAREASLRRLNGELNFDRMVCELERQSGNTAAEFDFLAYLHQIRDLVDAYIIDATRGHDDV